MYSSVLKQLHAFEKARGLNSLKIVLSQSDFVILLIRFDSVLPSKPAAQWWTLFSIQRVGATRMEWSAEEEKLNKFVILLRKNRDRSDSKQKVCVSQARC